MAELCGEVGHRDALSWLRDILCDEDDIAFAGISPEYSTPAFPGLESPHAVA
jgi:hypothetical protein